MKILLFGDASNYHYALSRGLARLGHEVTVASNGSRWMDTVRNIDTSRKPGKINGALLWTKLNTVLSGQLKGYDVVQLVNPVFVELRPTRVAQLFKKLKKHNGKIFLTALGCELAYIDMVKSSDCPLRYTEFAVDGVPTPYALSAQGKVFDKWLENPLRSLAQMIYDNVDGVVSALYEYHLAMERFIEPERLAYGGIPVDLSGIPFSPPAETHRLKVALPCHPGRAVEKGTDILEKLARRVPDIELTPITGLKYNEFVNELLKSDVVLDQYYSYTPATTALLAMAMGKTVVTGAEPAFEKFIGEKVPAFNIDPFNHRAFIEFMSGDEIRRNITERGVQARAFVERNNDASVVAQRFINLWQR